MNEIIIKRGQSIMDIALKKMGSVEAVFQLALINGIDMTERLDPGTILKVPANSIEFKSNADFATAVDNTYNIGIQPFTGVGYWQIENDFIIS